MNNSGNRSTPVCCICETSEDKKATMPSVARLSCVSSGLVFHANLNLNDIVS